MSRITIPTRDEAPAASQPILDQVGKTIGFIPNVLRLLSRSPKVLEAFVTLQSQLAKTLDVKTRDGIAIAVSSSNGCNYCMGIHSLVSHQMNKQPIEEITANLSGQSNDPRKAAAATFAKRLIEMRGKVADADLKAARDAGFKDEELLEIAAFTAQVLMTNFMNNVAETEIDFPDVRPK